MHYDLKYDNEDCSYSDSDADSVTESKQDGVVINLPPDIIDYIDREFIGLDREYLGIYLWTITNERKIEIVSNALRNQLYGLQPNPLPIFDVYDNNTHPIDNGHKDNTTTMLDKLEADIKSNIKKKKTNFTVPIDGLSCDAFKSYFTPDNYYYEPPSMLLESSKKVYDRLVTIFKKLHKKYLIEFNPETKKVIFIRYSTGKLLKSSSIIKSAAKKQKELYEQIDMFVDECMTQYDKYMIVKTRLMRKQGKTTVNIDIARSVHGIKLPSFITNKKYNTLFDKINTIDNDGNGGLVSSTIFVTEHIQPKLFERLAKYKENGYNIEFVDKNMYEGTSSLFNIKVTAVDLKPEKLPEAAKADGDHDRCPICLVSKSNIALNCGHLFCPDCITFTSCPTCHEKIYKKLKIYI